MKSDRKNLIETFKRLVEKSGAELPGYQFPIEAKVIEQRKSGGAYTVDVQVLKADGEPDEDWPVLTDVPVSTSMGTATDQVGVSYTIESGTRVAVSFFEGDPGRPFLSAIFSEQPPEADGIYWIIKTRNTRIGVEDNRNVFIESLDASATITLNLNGSKLIIGDDKIDLGEGEEPVMGKVLNTVGLPACLFSGASFDPLASQIVRVKQNGA